METLGSERIQPDVAPGVECVPLSGEKLALAIQSMESPNFLMRLTARIMKLAKQKGFHSPFKDSMELPGGKSAADLAGDIVEKAMTGAYNWNHEQFPNFYHFCLSRAESILSNWLARAQRSRSMSPLMPEDSESEQTVPNALNTAIAPDDIYVILRMKDGGALGDRFLEDFALSLLEETTEQKIVFAVFDDRECANRAYCREKLALSEDVYDAAVKRIIRRLPGFVHEWRGKNQVNDADWREAR